MFTGDTVLGPGDVALVKTQKPVFGRDALGPVPPRLGSEVQPICLPPKPNFRMDPAISDKGATEALEDMDCFFEKGAPGIVDWLGLVYTNNRRASMQSRLSLPSH